MIAIAGKLFNFAGKEIKKLNRNNMESRLRQLRKELKLTQESLARQLGIGKSALSMIETGKASLSERNKNILVQGLNVNPDWLESGRGEMFNAPPDVRSFLNRDDNNMPLQSVPLYDLEGTDGFAALLEDSSGYKPVDYVRVPNMPRCDGAIYLVGDGMAPLLKSGDIVMYRRLTNLDDIFWGDMYLLSIDSDDGEYVTVRYVRRSDRSGYLRLAGYNDMYDDKEVEVSRIRGIAFVKASIRMNSIL